MLGFHQRTDLLAIHYLLEITNRIHIKDIDRHIILTAHGDSSQVHHFELHIQHLVIGDMGELGADELALHYTVGEHAAEKNIDLLLCVGNLSKEIVAGAKSKNPEMQAFLFSTKEELLEKLPELLVKGDSILIKASHFMQFDKIVNAIRHNIS